jgi:hypothetical protein
MHLRWIIITIISLGERFSLAFVVRSPFEQCYNSHSLRNKRWARIATAPTMMAMIDPNNVKDEDQSDTNTVVENDASSDNFLEKVIFDPEAPSNENNWFANLVKNDYYTAEALYAGVIVIIGVIVAQDMLRIVKYGGGFHAPFSSGPGKLF